MLFLSLLFALTSVPIRKCRSVDAFSPVFQGDLFLKGNNVTTIEGRFDINGSIRVEENATLCLKNAVINFTQSNDFERDMIFANPLNGNPKLFAENASIVSNDIVWFFNNSTGTLNNCNITGKLDVYDNSNVVASESILKSLEVAGYSHVRLVNSKIIDYIFLSGYNEVLLINSTYGWHIFDYWAPKIYVAWYLNVHVVNAYSENVPTANVTATFQNGTLAESKFTDTDGWVNFILIEKVVDSFGNHTVGNYTITTTSEACAEQESVNLTGNKETTIKLPIATPEFPSVAIALLFIVLTLFTVVFVKKSKTKAIRLIGSLRPTASLCLHNA